MNSMDDYIGRNITTIQQQKTLGRRLSNEHTQIRKVLEDFYPSPTCQCVRVLDHPSGHCSLMRIFQKLCSVRSTPMVLSTCHFDSLWYFFLNFYLRHGLKFYILLNPSSPHLVILVMFKIICLLLISLSLKGMDYSHNQMHKYKGLINHINQGKYAEYWQYQASKQQSFNKLWWMR